MVCQTVKKTENMIVFLLYHANRGKVAGVTNLTKNVFMQLPLIRTNGTRRQVGVQRIGVEPVFGT